MSSSSSQSSSDSDDRRHHRRRRDSRSRRRESPADLDAAKPRDNSRSDGGGGAQETRVSSMERFRPRSRSSSESEDDSGSSDRLKDRRGSRVEFANGEKEKENGRDDEEKPARRFDNRSRVESVGDEDRKGSRGGEDGRGGRRDGVSSESDDSDSRRKVGVAEGGRNRVSDDRGRRRDEEDRDRREQSRRDEKKDKDRRYGRKDEVSSESDDSDGRRKGREAEGGRNRVLDDRGRRRDEEDRDRREESRRDEKKDQGNLKGRDYDLAHDRRSDGDKARSHRSDRRGRDGDDIVRKERRERMRDEDDDRRHEDRSEMRRGRIRDDERNNGSNKETRRESNQDRVRESPRREERERREHRREKLSESPPRLEKDKDRRNHYRDERRREGAAEEQKGKEKEISLPMPDPKAGKTGGAYIPPFKLARMMRDVQDKSSNEYQRLSWDALRKSINGLVNKVNATNIKNIIPELFAENLIRGRGLFCRSCMKSQMASPGFTDVFAALAAVVNTKFPEVGRLLLLRIVLQLKRAYKRNDKPQLLAATKFIAHLVNQLVAHEIIALELLTVLLQEPTDDSVEVAVGFVKECGALLQDISPQGLHGIFERFRGILHEGEIDKRVQFLIEGLFAIRKAKFQGFPAIRPELDLVEQEDQFTHEVSLDEEIDPETHLDIFKPNPNFVEDEKAYENLKKSILGAESSEDEEGSDAGSDDEDEEEDEDEDEEDEEQMKIKDETETNLVNLRRTIYLTIMSSVDFEEAGHKLMKIKLEPGQEMELCIMLLECCSQERTYLRYYGLLGQRFCMINKVHQENFEKCFVEQYSMIHRLETNKLRNVAKFFAHLLGTDALPWHVLAYIRLTEEDTTSSSRIFIKILFQELSEHLGIRLLNERLNDPTMKDSFESIFPKDNPKNTRFAINFFTSIGLGGITESLREYLKNMPRLIMQQQQPVESDSGGSDSSSESDSDAEAESSSSESEDRRQQSKRRRKH